MFRSMGDGSKDPASGSISPRGTDEITGANELDNPALKTSPTSNSAAREEEVFRTPRQVADPPSPAVQSAPEITFLTPHQQDETSILVSSSSSGESDKSDNPSSLKKDKNIHKEASSSRNLADIHTAGETDVAAMNHLFGSNNSPVENVPPPPAVAADGENAADTGTLLINNKKHMEEDTETTTDMSCKRPHSSLTRNAIESTASVVVVEEYKIVTDRWLWGEEHVNKKIKSDDDDIEGEGTVEEQSGTGMEIDMGTQPLPMEMEDASSVGSPKSMMESPIEMDLPSSRLFMDVIPGSNKQRDGISWEEPKDDAQFGCQSQLGVKKAASLIQPQMMSLQPIVTEDLATESSSSTEGLEGNMAVEVEIDDETELEEEVPDDTLVLSQPRLPIIPALCIRYMFQGLPAYRFAVRAVDSSDVIYEFQVDTGPSWIKNAGNGAFLTFLGARQRKTEILEAKTRPEPLKLLGGTVNDRLVSLKLKGKGLGLGHLHICDSDATVEADGKRSSDHTAIFFNRHKHWSSKPGNIGPHERYIGGIDNDGSGSAAGIDCSSTSSDDDSDGGSHNDNFSSSGDTSITSRTKRSGCKQSETLLPCRSTMKFKENGPSSLIQQRESPICCEQQELREESSCELEGEGCGKSTSMQKQWLTTLPPLFSNEDMAVEYSHNVLGLGHDDSLEHYEANNNLTFSSEGLGCVDLGHYAPFIRTDQKNQSLSDIKSFVWHGLPSSYQFEFDNSLDVVWGRKKVADITGEFTGVPHKAARSNISMYVNETGGDKALKQTVWANDYGDEGIHYLFNTKNIGEMKKGDTIELLISYNESYDEMRSRMGYGTKNSPKSDSHLPTYLERQFVERFNMTEEIMEDMTDADINAICQLLGRINDRIGILVDDFLECDGEQGKTPGPHVFVALRRIHWLKPILEHKAESMVGRYRGNLPLQNVLDQCHGTIKLLGRGDWPEILTLLDSLSIRNNEAKRTWDVLRREVVEEVCYKIHAHLKLPCNEDVFCCVATELIFDLSVAVAKQEWKWGKARNPEALLESFLEIASKAAAAIRQPADIRTLTLGQNCWKYFALENRSMLKDQPEGTRCLLTYIGGEEKYFDAEPEPMVVVEEATHDMELKNVVHIEFYLSRQVIFVVDAFAKRYLAGLPSYSLEALCNACDITLQKAIQFEKKLRIGSSGTHPFFSSNDYQHYQNGHNIRNPESSLAASSIPFSIFVDKSTPDSSKKRSVNKLVFWRIVWVDLQDLGWTMDRGNRPGDWYLCPPGVVRGQGARPRFDFFDSIPLVRQCLESDDRYCHQSGIQRIVRIFRECEKELQLLKAKEKEGTGIKFARVDDLVDYLREKAEDRTREATETDAVLEREDTDLCVATTCDPNSAVKEES